MSTRDFTFRAKTVEAHTIKSLSEVLQSILTDACFTFDKDGVKLLTVDNKRPAHLFIHLSMSGESFDEYYCPIPLTIGINLQHLYKMLKSIKKKDTIMLFISKKQPGSLGITTIQSDSGQPVTSYIKIQKLSQIIGPIPDEYSHPIHISTTTYQKMCKDMQGISSRISVYSKGSYLRFSCEVEGMYTRTVPFGDEDNDETIEEYEDVFFTKSLSQLLKVSGLNGRMQIYTPPVDSEFNTPLKISINTGDLGKLEIYIKSIGQLEKESKETSY